MKEPSTCSQCGQPLAPDAPQGLCPACLLKLAATEQTDALDSSVMREADPSLDVPVASLPEIGFNPAGDNLARLFPQLEILQQIGAGGMGVVYKARQKQLDRIVALKLMHPRFSRDPQFAERFNREARALAKLSHPNIVHVYEFGTVGGSGDRDEQFYFVMEYVDGANLQQLIGTKALTAPQALAIVPKLCDALQYAHDEGVVHRDIKPANILVDKKGRVKIADFGLAKIAGVEDGRLTRTNQGMGTMMYMAPEQMENAKSVDHRADIYSLGVVFYEMLTGELPMGRFANPSQTVGVDVRFDEIVLHALERDVNRRYQHASEVKTDVENVTSAPRAEAVRSSAASSGEPQLSSPALWGAIWAPLVLLGGAALIYAYSNPDSPAVVKICMALFMLIGMSAPFGATILGAVAVAQIKRSGGRRYGIRLALADALLFPLLVLDFIIMTPVAAGVMGILVAVYRMGPRDNLVAILPTILTLIISLPLAAWIDFLIVRRVWRATTGQPIHPQAPANEIKPGAENTANTPAAKKATPRQRQRLAILGAAAGALLLLFIVSIWMFSGGPATSKGESALMASYAVLTAIGAIVCLVVLASAGISIFVEWRNDQFPLAWLVVRSVLRIAAAFCFVCFFGAGTSVSSAKIGRVIEAVTLFRIGTPFPWFESGQSGAGEPFHMHLIFASWAWAILAAGLLCLYALRKSDTFLPVSGATSAAAELPDGESAAKF